MRGISKSISRPLQPQVLAQRGAFIFSTKQPAPLQLRHQQLRDVFQTARQMRHQHIEAVCRAVFEPGLQLIGDLRRRADQTVVPSPTGNSPSQLCQGQVFLIGQLSQQLLPTALAAVGPECVKTQGKPLL
ncbi:Histidyl-tRNA synthetase [Pseudomonas syringae pv. actinidiae]|uniref:Histidyl-tRNA synthetase n=1 Tax=Pseudomonas syringae pv. actinidiae TaxID=103796 RepID=A0A2V0QXH3_PSESF|nr:Histidyl-tRNA synthetase [Pseudomonas syringae pv. actinidiae]